MTTEQNNLYYGQSIQKIKIQPKQIVQYQCKTGTKSQASLLNVPHTHTLHLPTPVSDKSLQNVGPQILRMRTGSKVEMRTERDVKIL